MIQMLENLKLFLQTWKKISDVKDNEVAKNKQFNTLKTKVNNLEKKIPDTTTLIHTNQYNTDKQNLVKKLRILIKNILDMSGLVTRKCFEYKN